MYKLNATSKFYLGVVSLIATSAFVFLFPGERGTVSSYALAFPAAAVSNFPSPHLDCVDKKYDYVEVGCSDFYTLIQEHANDDVCGVSVEAVKRYIDALPSGAKNKIKLNSAVVQERNSTPAVVYAMPEELMLGWRGSGAKGSCTKSWEGPGKFHGKCLPGYVRGMNSVSHPHPNLIKMLGEDVFHAMVEKLEVPQTTLADILSFYRVASLGTLKVDTEGYDSKLLLGYLKASRTKAIEIDRITFEGINSPQEEVAEIMTILNEWGYNCIQEKRGNQDVTCRNNSK